MSATPSDPTLAPAAAAAPETDTRGRILDTAERLLLTRGYAGFSYQDIAAAVGIRKASIHHHFPAKEDLGRAVVERARTRLRESRGTIEPLPATVRRLFDGYFRLFERMAGEEAGICLGGRLGADYALLPETVREPYHAFVGEFGAWLQALIQAGQRCGVVRAAAPPEEMALLVTATVQGAVQLSRTRGVAVYRRIVDQLRQQILT